MTTRDPFVFAMEVLLEGERLRAQLGRKVNPHSDSPPTTPRPVDPKPRTARPARRVEWVGAPLGDVLAADVGRVVLTVQDARHGVEVVEVVSWSPRTRGAALGRLERVLGAEQLRGVGCYVGEVVR